MQMFDHYLYALNIVNIALNAVNFYVCLGSLTSLSFDPLSRHCLVSYRPSQSMPKTRHMVIWNIIFDYYL